MKNLKDMTLQELWRLFPIILKDHNPEYETWYENEKTAICLLLAGFNIYRISHIGSTAVKGLIAKPIVDILLELNGGYDSEKLIKMLQNEGWLLMAKNAADSTLDLNKGYTPNGFAEKVFHLHIKPTGDWGELYFRDYLKCHAEAAKRYETLKSGLKERFEFDRDAYTNAKTDFIQKCTLAARKEFLGRYTPKI